VTPLFAIFGRTSIRANTRKTARYRWRKMFARIIMTLSTATHARLSPPPIQRPRRAIAFVGKRTICITVGNGTPCDFLSFGRSLISPADRRTTIIHPSATRRSRGFDERTRPVRIYRLKRRNEMIGSAFASLTKCGR